MARGMQSEEARQLNDWIKDFKTREMKCDKENKTDLHKKRIAFKGLRKEQVQDLFPSIYDPVFRLLTNMGNLTGIITFQNSRTGTCFLQRIRPKTKTNEKEYVLTFTTAYHNFGDKENNIYKLETEWNPSEVKVGLFYDHEDDNITFLENFGLIESDKEIDIMNDWCAIECDTEDSNLVNDLKGYLNNFEETQKEIYKLSKCEEHQNQTHNVVIVGHPHGRPKQISIGEHFEGIKEIAREVRSGQVWCRYYYDAPTCPGNSGSPVFIFGQPITGFGYWYGHPHNHKQSVTEKEIVKKAGKQNLLCLGMSTIGVEQTHK